MNKRELQRYGKLIEEEKRRILENLGMIEEGIQAHAVGQSGNQSYSNHMADIGSDAMETEQAFLHASQGTRYLVALEQAQKRIEKGIYGTCEECGDKIPAKRLEAYLPARYCVPCKGKLEKLRRS
jgi:DnaK suppressor protein